MHVAAGGSGNQPWGYPAYHAFDHGKGDAAHLFIVDHVLSDIERTSLISPASVEELSGLIRYYKMDDVSGTTAVDTTGTQDGTYNGGVTLGVAGSPWGGTAARFDGVDDWLDMGALPANLQTMTLGVWINLDTYTDIGRTLFDLGSQTEVVGLLICPDYDDGTFFAGIWGADTGSGGFAMISADRPDSGWQLLLISFDIDNLGQNSNYLGPRPKIRLWYGGLTEDEIPGVSCNLLAEDDVLLIDSSAGDATIPLPPAASATNHIYYIKNIDSNVVTLDPADSETIDAAATLDLEPYDSAAIVSDGLTAWWVL